MKYLMQLCSTILPKLSARGAIMAQVISFFLLMLPVVVHSIWAEWLYAQTMQRIQLVNTAKLLAARQTALVRGAESLLLALSSSPAIRHGNSKKIFSFLIHFNLIQQDYAGVALFRTDGSSLFSILDGKPRVLSRDTALHRAYFQQGLSSSGFAIGDSLEIEDGRLVLPMTFPVTTEDDGPVSYLLMLPLSLDQQHHVLDAILSQNRSQVAFFDGVQKTLFLYPEQKKRSFSPEFIRQTLLPHAFQYTDGCTSDQVFEFVSDDGKSLIGSMTSLYQGEGGRPYMSILVFDEHISWNVFLRQQHVLQLAALLGVTFFLLIVASCVGKKCFADGLSKMADVALRTEEGQTDMRCGQLRGCKEIIIAGRAFDKMLDSLQANVQKLKVLSTHDALTGLWNRRQFDEVAVQEINTTLRYGHPLSLAMADIDYFKRINDTHGHKCGDAVLQELARLFRENIRSADIVARFGGEEFVFLFPHTVEEDAATALDTLRRLCAGNRVAYQGQTVRYTVSFGVASLPQDAEGASADVLEDLIRKADAALYASKVQGRNRVTRSSSLES